jgi:hypothetical protein
MWTIIAVPLAVIAIASLFAHYCGSEKFDAAEDEWWRSIK